VNFVSWHGVYFSRVNAQLSCSRFDLPLLGLLLLIGILCSAERVSLQSAAHCSAVSVIRDMLCVKSRQMMIPGFESTDIDFMLESMCIL